MTDNTSKSDLLARIEELENRLEESEQLIEAIKAGQVDAFALNTDNNAEVFTLQSGDYAYRVLIENFNEGALNLSEDGLIVYTNNYFYDLLELPYEKVIGRQISELIHPSSKAAFRKLFSKGLAGQAKGEINLAGANKTIPVYISLTSLYPRLQTVGMIVTDLTEKKKQEKFLEQQNQQLENKNQELRQQKELLQTILNSTPDLIGVYDREMRILEFNRACEEFFQMKREEVLGKVFYEVFPTTKGGKGHLDLTRALAGETIKNLDYLSPLTQRHYQNLIRPLQDSKGDTTGAIVIAHDVTEVIEFTEKVKQSEEKFNKLFSASPFGLTLSEIPSGKVLDANETYLQIVGYNKEECVGHTSLELNLIDAADRQKILDELLKEGYIKNAEANIRTKTGRIVPVLVSIDTVNIGDSQYHLSAIVDITARKEAERSVAEANTDLKKMNEELKSFAYISSHDLQEPLRKITTFASWIIDNERDKLSDTGRNYFQRMHAAAGRMQLLIDDLLSYSRATTQERVFDEVDLKAIVEQVKLDLQEEANAKDAIIQSGSPCVIKAIPFQIKQLFFNIISNSLKFVRQGQQPVIQIKTEVLSEDLSPIRYSKACHITISDNGIGFDAQYSERIFELFQRLHGKAEYAGTGIGLAIVKKIVENHNGIITASGRAGEGATFDIYLPL